MRRGRRAAGLASLAAALVAVACVGIEPPPPDRFYRLTPALEPPRRAAEPLLAGTLRVERPRADPLVGGRAILWSRGPEAAELERHRYHHWVEPPPGMVAEHLVEMLRRANLAGSVVPAAVRAEADFRLTGRLERFERVLGGEGPGVQVALRLALHPAGQGAVLWRGEYEVHRRAAGDAVVQAVAAFEEALEEVLSRATADLLEAAPRVEERRRGAMLRRGP